MPQNQSIYYMRLVRNIYYGFLEVQWLTSHRRLHGNFFFILPYFRLIQVASSKTSNKALLDDGCNYSVRALFPSHHEHLFPRKYLLHSTRNPFLLHDTHRSKPRGSFEIFRPGRRLEKGKCRAIRREIPIIVYHHRYGEGKRGWLSQSTTARLVTSRGRPRGLCWGIDRGLCSRNT